MLIEGDSCALEGVSFLESSWTNKALLGDTKIESSFVEVETPPIDTLLVLLSAILFLFSFKLGDDVVIFEGEFNPMLFSTPEADLATLIFWV